MRTFSPKRGLFLCGWLCFGMARRGDHVQRRRSEAYPLRGVAGGLTRWRPGSLSPRGLSRPADHSPKEPQGLIPWGAAPALRILLATGKKPWPLFKARGRGRGHSESLRASEIELGAGLH